MALRDGELISIRYLEVFPWLHLFRAFRIALDFRKMALGALALTLLGLGDWLISTMPFVPAPQQAALRGVDIWPWEDEQPFVSLMDYAATADRAGRPLEAARDAALDWRIAFQPSFDLFNRLDPFATPGVDWRDLALASTRFLWALLVAAIFGGAIARIAAVQFARDQNVGLQSGLSFARSHFAAYISAPLLPLVGALILSLICLVLISVTQVTGVGPVIVGALWFVPLLLVFVITLILVGVLIGLPFMFATISAEGRDGFDAFSRSYSYVYQKPWLVAWYLAVATVIGGVSSLLVVVAARWVAYVPALALGRSSGHYGIVNLRPRLVGGEGFPMFQELSLADTLFGLWNLLFAALVAGYIYSYFWSAMTIAWFLLRKADDAVELDEVFIAPLKLSSELPLVGVAASPQPVIERPPFPDRTPVPSDEPDV